MASGHWQMVGGPVGQSVQPAMPNHVLIVTDAAAPARHAAERQMETWVRKQGGKQKYKQETVWPR